MNRNELKSQKEAMVDNYRASGLTAARWCEENQVKLSNLRYWITKQNRQETFHNTEAAFVEFSPLPEAAPLSVCIGAFRIELNPGFDALLLRDVVQALKSL